MKAYSGRLDRIGVAVWEWGIFFAAFELRTRGVGIRVLDEFVPVKLAEIPTDEAQRQQSLDKLKLVDTPIEGRFDRITRIATRLIGVPIATITLIDGNRQWFKSVRGFPFREGPRKLSFCGHTVFQNEPLVVEDATKDPRFADNPTVTGDPGIRFYAGCPVHAPDGQTIGSLCVIGKEARPFGQADLEDLQDLAAMAEAEIRWNRLSEAQEKMTQELNQAKRAAMIDSLTGIWNRAGGEELLARQQEIATQKGEKFHVAILDIDHFKKINDTYGHAAGDEVLREMARRMLRALRPSDFACRMGGEEFLVMIATGEPEEARKVAEAVRQQVRFGAVHVEGKAISVTASIGLACFDPAHPDGEKTIGLADACLYEAKKRGRDRIVLHVD